MATHTTISRTKHIEARGVRGASWLEIIDEDGNTTSVYMPLDTAIAMQAAWDRANEKIGVAA